MYGEIRCLSISWVFCGLNVLFFFGSLSGCPLAPKLALQNAEGKHRLQSIYLFLKSLIFKTYVLG